MPQPEPSPPAQHGADASVLLRLPYGNGLDRTFSVLVVVVMALITATCWLCWEGRPRLEVKVWHATEAP
jgi:hypothetical protein